MLRRVIPAGTGTRARVCGYDLAGKTGTTCDYKDAWFVGYTGGFVAAVWIGKDNNTPMRQGHRRHRAGRDLARLHGPGPVEAAGRGHPLGPGAPPPTITDDPIGDLLNQTTEGRRRPSPRAETPPPRPQQPRRRPPPAAGTRSGRWINRPISSSPAEAVEGTTRSVVEGVKAALAPSGALRQLPRKQGSSEPHRPTAVAACQPLASLSSGVMASSSAELAMSYEWSCLDLQVGDPWATTGPGP